MTDRPESIEALVGQISEAILPDLDMTLLECAERFRVVDNEVAFGNYDPWFVPYMREPQLCMSSKAYDSVIFVGPARTSKTDAASNFLLHTALCRPGQDAIVYAPSRDAATEFSNQKISALLKSPEFAAQIPDTRRARTVFNLRTRAGGRLRMSWPSTKNFAGVSYGWIWLPDYDRAPKDIGGEGEPFTLAFKRTQTFPRKMVVAESSPSREPIVKKWKPDTPHDAPPTTGIVALYTQGDRRRWYWPCLDGCGQFFRADWKQMWWPKDEGLSVERRAAGCGVRCPHCGHFYAHDGDTAKEELNLHGVWLRDGEHIDEFGEITGEIISPSRRASFWMQGPAAKFTKWPELVAGYLHAVRQFETTGDDNALRSFVNTSIGDVYFPPAIGEERLAEPLMKRAAEMNATRMREVPPWVRVLFATVDCGKHAFDVGVFGYGLNGESVLVDRFEIRKSERLDKDGERYPVSPPREPLDWDLLIPGVMMKRYPVAGSSGLEMEVHAMGVDYGGLPGTTTNAVEFFRRVRVEQPRSVAEKLYLIRGERRTTAPLSEIRYPDSNKTQKARGAGFDGSVPALHLGSMKIKDAVAAFLDRDTPGPGFVHLPHDLEIRYFDELVAEERRPEGWFRPHGAANETWDLMTYAYGLYRHLKLELFTDANVDRAPSWFAPIGENSRVYAVEDHSADDIHDKVENTSEAAYRSRETPAATPRDWSQFA